MIIKQINIYNRLVYIFCILFLFLIPIYSLDIIDSGFILSFIGRLKLGHQIYKDFDYVRPFGTPIFWELLLKPFPINSAYLLLIARYLVILQFLTMGVLTAKILYKSSCLKHYLLFTVLIIGNFVVMPWHTTDGLFFSIISIYFLNKDKFLTSIIFALIAASCQQSFYFIPIFIIFFIIISSRNKPFKISKYDALIFILAFFIILYILTNYNIFDNYAYLQNQLKSSSNFRQFLTISIINYVKPFYALRLNLIFIAYLIINVFYRKYSKVFHLINLIILLFTFVFSYQSFEIQRAIFTIYFIINIFQFKHKRNIILFLLVGWCCSISWGYSTPIMSLLLVVVYENSGLLTCKKYIKLTSALLVFTLFFGILRLFRHYANDSFLKSDYTLVQNKKIISGIYMPVKTRDYFTDGENLYKKYGWKAIFLPGMPLIDVINSSFPNRASWESDVEYPNYKRDILRKENLIILDKNEYNKYKLGFYKSTYTNNALSVKKLIDSSNHFYLYK